MIDILILLTVLVVAILIASIKIVEQNTVLVIEFLGKYSRMMNAGFNLTRGQQSKSASAKLCHRWTLPLS
jgi:regulator of protease activity HflC (stomatin/prohibitin superfamily)